MTLFIAATWAFAALLAVAGIRKITDPAATEAALQGARLPSDQRLVRLLGAGEVVLAAAVLGLGGALPAALVAVAYAAFAVFAFRQSRRGAGCGCFGESDAPATNLHVAMDAAAAVMAAVAATQGAPAVRALAADGAAALLFGIALLVTATAALRLALTALPEVATAVRLVTPEDAA